MAMNCRSCGAALSEGADRCSTCFALVKPPGFFQRLFGGLKINFSVNHDLTGTGKSSFNIQTTVHRTFKIRDAATGETKEYHSLEEVPEKYREQMTKAIAGEHVESR